MSRSYFSEEEVVRRCIFCSDSLELCQSFGPRPVILAPLLLRKSALFAFEVRGSPGTMALLSLYTLLCGMTSLGLGLEKFEIIQRGKLRCSTRTKCLPGQATCLPNRSTQPSRPPPPEAPDLPSKTAALRSWQTVHPSSNPISANLFFLLVRFFFELSNLLSLYTRGPFVFTHLRSFCKLANNG
jgi:hypothetical protein